MKRKYATVNFLTLKMVCSKLPNGHVYITYLSRDISTHTQTHDQIAILIIGFMTCIVYSKKTIAAR